MIENGCDVTTHFDQSTNDWTPEWAKQKVTVLYSPFAQDETVSQNCYSVLSKVEVERSERFKTVDLKQQFLQRRAFRRYCAVRFTSASQPLAMMSFNETESGCPKLLSDPSCWFSFASVSEGFVCVYSTNQAVGVDLEDISKPLEVDEMARNLYSHREALIVSEAGCLQDRKLAFLKIWCLKEAALKSIGKGLPFGLNAFEFSLDPLPRTTKVPPTCDLEGIEASLFIRGNLVLGLIVRRLN